MNAFDAAHVVSATAAEGRLPKLGATKHSHLHGPFRA
jgi:hypothetical protein